MNKQPKPLYRKWNTRVLHPGYWLNKYDGEYRWERQKNKKDFETTTLPMKKNRGAGYDYTPLYQYLRSHVGENWNDIYSKILPRLPNTKEGREAWTIFVLQPGDEVEPLIWYGPRSMFSALYIDDKNLLQVVDPTVGVEHCNAPYGKDFPETYTLNGKRIMKTDPDKGEFDYDQWKESNKDKIGEIDNVSKHG